MKNFWKHCAHVPMGRNPRNTETQFSEIDLDSEDNWKKNPNLDWRPDSFTYKFNSCGYRSREFDFNDPRPVMLGLGCSHTMGVGIPFSDTWVEQLGKQFPGYKVYNLGQGGCSNDAIARLLTNVVTIFKPILVSILWTHRERFETYENNAEQQHGSWSEDKFVTQFDQHNAYNNYTKNKLIVHLLRDVYKFELLENDIEYMSEKYTPAPLARDNSHNGSKWNKSVAQDFYEQYKEKINV